MSVAVILAIWAAATEPAASPPLPPVVVVSPSVRVDTVPLATLDIGVTAEREPLWSGSLRVGGYIGASYAQTLRQPPEPCAGLANASESGDRFRENTRELSLNLGRRGGRDTPDGFYVNLRWARPGMACGGGTRSVALDQFVEIGPGRTVTLTGDAGLVVTLTRRAER